MRHALAFLLLTTSACADAAQSPAPAVAAEAPVHGYRIVKEYPHDPRAFTQGLFWLRGHLYESTGQIGRSTLRKVRLEDGEVLQSAAIPPRLFGEGIVNWGDEIISITWQGGIGFRWDLATFARKSEFRYPGEGWGLTQNGRDIIMSDGTAELRFLDPVTLTERRRLPVTANGEPLASLNELEYVNGEIWANIFMTGFIARIDPATGAVKSWIDLRDLAARMSDGNPDTVLNGIAWDGARKRLFVTGKNWPSLFEIEVVPQK